MRTVTFSDVHVAEAVNTNFVAAWINRDPTFTDDDTTTEKRIFEHVAEGFATKNICTFFLTSEGRVFGYVAGYVEPNVFLSEVDLALRIHRKAFNASPSVAEEVLDAVTRLHSERAREFTRVLALDADELVQGFVFPAYRAIEHKHTQRCAKVLRETYTYLERLHNYWSSIKELPDFESVRYSYEYGSEFTEESSEAKKIERRPPDWKSRDK